jgi:hypothetical protein
MGAMVSVTVEVMIDDADLLLSPKSRNLRVVCVFAGLHLICP